MPGSGVLEWPKTALVGHWRVFSPARCAETLSTRDASVTPRGQPDQRALRRREKAGGCAPLYSARTGGEDLLATGECHTESADQEQRGGEVEASVERAETIGEIAREIRRENAGEHAREVEDGVGTTVGGTRDAIRDVGDENGIERQLADKSIDDERAKEGGGRLRERNEEEGQRGNGHHQEREGAAGMYTI